MKKNINKAVIVLVLLFSFNTLNGQNLSGVRIHINPGHGGWDSDDRGIPTPLFPSVGPNVGFWESQSNLDKGLQLKAMLEELGATVQISRTQNRTEDDLPLSQIVRMANEFNSDFMLSIHSNAGSGTANHVLMLYAGIDLNDPQKTYPTPTPKSDESRAISTEIAKNLVKNQLTHWTSANYNVSGDKTFARLYMGWSDGYGVTRGLTVPGVISEGSMHDYIPETYRLMNMEYKWLEAWNFKKAFCTYFKNAEIPTGNIAGYVKDGRNLILDGTYKKYGKDLLLPINGATVTILETGEVYTVDNKRNGIFVFKNLQPGTYSVKVEAEGYYAQTSQVVVTKNEITYEKFELNKVRNTPPEVVKYTPNSPLTEPVNTSTDIVLEFNWDMDEASTSAAFSITPHVDGKLTFEDSQYRLRFKPNFPLEKSTVYTVKLDKSAKHPDNKTMVEDFVFQFMTKDRNRLMVLENYPNDGNKGVYATKPQFYILFDKKLNSSNVRDEINVYNSNGTMISKATRSILINKVGSEYGDFFFELAEPLVAGNNYVVKLGGDIMDDTGVKTVDPMEINFTASSVIVTDKTVIDDFETANKYTYNADESENSTAASMVRSTAQKLFGSSSYQMKTTFTDNNASSVFKLNEPLSSTENDKVFGLHVFGDMSGNELQLQFTSTAIATDVRYIKLCDLNFMGWEFVEAKFPDETVPFRLTGFRLVRQEGILSSSVSIFVDNLLQYEKSLTGLSYNKSDANWTIYPNPASKFFNIQIQSEKLPIVQLYSLNGVLLKTEIGNKISVAEFANGTYILKAKIDNNDFTKVVMISR